MTIPMTDAALDLEKTTVAHCFRRSPFRSWPAWVSCGVFLLSFGVFYIFWCTNSLYNYIHMQLPLRNGTISMSMWEHPPVKLHFEIYVFNYTNMEDFLAYKAKKLHVEELGPYIYLETKKRINVVHEDDRLTYQEEKMYEWIGGRSEDDFIVVPNIPMLSSSAYAKELSFGAQLGIMALLTSFQEKPFIRVKAGDFFWGYDDAFIDMVKPFLRFKQELPFEKFGIFVAQKGVDKNRITINAGTHDINKLGIIERLNGLSNRYIWGDERCDNHKGTDGTIFPPNLIDNNDTLYLYSKEICRDIAFKFSEYITISNIPVLRYKSVPNTFKYTEEQNKCFCPKKGYSTVCPPEGIFDISPCKNDSPILISLPHFLGVEKSVTNQIEGLHPRIDHISYMDVYPIISAPIAGWSKYQINVQVRKALAVPLLGGFKDDMILPLVWFNIGLNSTELPEMTQDIIYQTNVILRITETILQWSSLVGMIISMGALLVCFKKHRMEHPDVGLQMNLVNRNKLEVA